jgi:hypothetical protein
MLNYLILIGVIIFLLKQNIDSFTGVIEKTDMIKQEKIVDYITDNNEYKSARLLNVPSLGQINNKLSTVKNNLITPYGTYLSTMDDMAIKKITNTEDKIKIKDIYTFL